MDSRQRQRAEGCAPPARIPLRPELVEFLSARCLSRYSRCSKAVSADVREANAWQLLANVQVPRPTRQTARDALENCALSRVRSYVRRRLLADALANTSSTRQFRPNRLEDFTFFVRIAKGGQLVWEGDLKNCSTTEIGIRLPLTEVWATMTRSGSCAELAAWLADTETVDDEDILGPYSITLVAIRDVDQAMVSLGHFSYDEHEEGMGDPRQEFVFLDSSRDRHLFAETGLKFKAHLYLGTYHDAAGGTLEYLNLVVCPYRYNRRRREDVQQGRLRSSKVQYLLAYLAGGQPHQRAEAISTMRSWNFNW